MERNRSVLPLEVWKFRNSRFVYCNVLLFVCFLVIAAEGLFIFSADKTVVSDSKVIANPQTDSIYFTKSQQSEIGGSKDVLNERGPSSIFPDEKVKTAEVEEDSTDDSIGGKGWLFLIAADAVLLLFAALFAGLTLALVGLDTLSLEIIADSGQEPDKSYARKILPIRQLGNQLLCTLIFGNVMVNTLIAQITDDHLHGWVATVISTALTTLGGEVIPQAVMSAHALQVGSKSAPIVKFFIVLFYPVSKPCSMLLDWAIGKDPGQIYERNELKKLMMIHAARSAETGIGLGEVDLMVGAMELHEKTVADVMSPIGDVLMLEANERLNDETIQHISDHGHSRIPVYLGSKNNIIGVLFAKDLLMIDPQENTKVMLLVKFYNRRCHVVPSDTKLISMLKYFQTGRTHIALVKEVQHSGGGDPFYVIKGMLTMEDVIEELIHSEIFDEYDVLPSGPMGSPDAGSGQLATQGWGSYNSFGHGANVFPRVQRPFAVGISTKFSRRIMLSENELTATALFLSKSLPELSEAVELPEALKTYATVHSVRSPKDARGLSIQDRQNIWLYRDGIPSSSFTLILSGKVEVFVGSVDMVVELGNWSMLASDAVRFLDWVPHFSCRVVKSSTVLQITRDDFVHILEECKGESSPENSRLLDGKIPNTISTLQKTEDEKTNTSSST